MDVPIVDLRATTAAADLDAACRSLGFLQVAGHDIPDELVAAMRAVTAEFFARPLGEKLALRSPAPEINRGYAAKGSEGLAYSVGAERPPDLFEAFNLGPDEVAPGAPWAATVHFAANLWPTEPPGFRSVMVEYFAAVQTLAHRLTALFAEALGLPEGFFEPFTDHSTDMLRVVNYERAAGDPDPLAEQLGMGEHTDYGIVTVLYADRVPGLQVLGPDRRWIDVVPEEGCFLVNLGDLTAEWTNDRWRSTLHRVLPPTPGLTRRSVAFFHDGNHDALVECLPTCCSAENPPRYPPVLAGDHLLAKLLGPRTLQRSTHTVDTAAGRLSAAR